MVGWSVLSSVGGVDFRRMIDGWYDLLIKYEHMNALCSLHP